MGKATLLKARAEKNDEFYTRLEDIEAEISMHPDYVRQFKDKVVFCNCDDPEWSNFHLFFRQHFQQLGLKKLITTHFNMDGSPSYKLEWSGEMLGDDSINMVKTPLKGDGDFRSEECVEILKSADIIVTNPPFSLFREYVALLLDNNKKFIIIGSKSAITYKEFFPLLQNDEVWVGYNAGHGTMYFSTEVLGGKRVDKKDLKGVPSYWYTNLDIDKKHEGIILTKNYKGNEEKYPKYDNYDAINVDKVKDIPKDYFGAIGVPITYLAEHSPEQFEILGQGQGNLFRQLTDKGLSQTFVDDYYKSGQTGSIKEGHPVLGYYNSDGKPVIPYMRIIIKRKV